MLCRRLSTVPSLTRPPTTTAAGPFATPPTFTPLPAPSLVLAVELPALLVLCTRSARLVAASGHTAALVLEAVVADRMVYSRSVAHDALLVLVQPRGVHTLFLVIQVEHQQWALRSEECAVAWTGGVSLRRQPRRLVSGAELPHYGAVVALGTGPLCVGGVGPLYTVQLRVGESMLVNPGAVVAHLLETNNEVQVVRLASRWRVPGWVGAARTKAAEWWGRLDQVGAIEPVETAPTQETPGQEPTPLYLAAIRRWIETTRARLSTRDLYVELRGPCTAVVHAHTASTRQVFSADEAVAVYREAAGQAEAESTGSVADKA